MFSNRLILGALAVACVAAAGAGGYFASRQNLAQSPALAATASQASDLERPAQPVQESEVVVDAAVPRTAAVPQADTRSAATSAPAERRVEATRPTAAASAARPPRETRQPLPTLDRPWPSATASSAPSPSTATPGPGGAEPAVADLTASNPAEPRSAPEIASTPEPPQKVFEEIVVTANSVIGLQTEGRISSETARVEDRVEARVTRDVRVGEEIAIPAGSRAVGSVTLVERGGKFKQQARLGIRFTTLVLADGTRLPMNTETIYREGEAPSNSTATKIGGGAVGGAILGAILGGAKGAAIGATAGAGGGAAAVQLGDRSEVTVPAGSPMTVRLAEPLTVTVER